MAEESEAGQIGVRPAPPFNPLWVSRGPPRGGGNLTAYYTTGCGFRFHYLAQNLFLIGHRQPCQLQAAILRDGIFD